MMRIADTPRFTLALIAVVTVALAATRAAPDHGDAHPSILRSNALRVPNAYSPDGTRILTAYTDEGCAFARSKRACSFTVGVRVAVDSLTASR